MPLAIMDGTIISAMRTGAVAGIACKHLAKKGATRLGMAGAGVIGRTVLKAVKAKWVIEGSLCLHMSGYECEYEVVTQSDKIVVDNWEDVKNRNSQTPAIMFHDGKLSDDDIHAEMAEILLEEKPGRESQEERIFFILLAWGYRTSS